MKKAAALVTLMALGGCVQSVVELETPFDPNAGTYISARGSGMISGQAFMRQAGGGVVTCAGEEVSLMPATAHQQERIKIIYGSIEGGRRTTGFGDVPPPLAPGAESLKKTTICDATGNFEFTGLAAGDYYVVTRVIWLAGDYYYNQGGLLAQRVRLSPGHKARVILN